MTQIRAVSAWLPSTSSGDAKSCSSEETASSCHCDPPKGTCCCGKQLDVVNAFPTAHCRGAQQSLGDTWSRSRSPRMGFARRKVVWPTSLGPAWLQHLDSRTHVTWHQGFVLLQPSPGVDGPCSVTSSLGCGLKAFFVASKLDSRLQWEN